VIARVGGLLACVPIVLSQVGPSAAVPKQQPSPPQRILIVGDSTAETIYPFLRDAGAPRGMQVFSAAAVGCGVIDGQPVLDDGRPYVDIVGDTRRCTATTESAQAQILDNQRPDMVVWISGWESWPNRVVDGQLVHFGTITGNKTILSRIDAAVSRLTAGGARLVFLPVAPNAYPSARGIANIYGDSRLADLANVLRGYARQHANRVSVIDLPTILACPTEKRCPAEVAPGIRPRDLDGFHFYGGGSAWLAEQIIGMLSGATPPPVPPAPPACAPASVGNGSAAVGGGKCAH
jgi:SGNH domain (fused to AT3 domains)